MLFYWICCIILLIDTVKNKILQLYRRRIKWDFEECLAPFCSHRILKEAAEEGGAGGKTGSAQTGIYREDEELVHAWFTGFYPALSPQYVIVVFVEEGESGAKAAAPIFKDIVDQLAKLDR